jgi:hypothetical protein
MIDSLEQSISGKERRRISEETILVCRGVPVPDLKKKLRFQRGRVERREVDHCIERDQLGERDSLGLE